MSPSREPTDPQLPPADAISSIFRFHQDIRRALGDLRELAASRELAMHQRALARRLCAFFTGPFQAHDHDEEAILLPRLRARTTRPEHIEALRLVSEDHDRMEEQLEEIVGCLQAIDEGSLLQLRSLDRLVKRLETVIEPHLQMEERHLIPLARACLDADELREMHAELVARASLRARGGRAAIPLVFEKRNGKGEP